MITSISNENQIIIFLLKERANDLMSESDEFLCNFISNFCTVADNF
jgi:hypothetical protein